jgi:hypothetical protein
MNADLHQRLTASVVIERTRAARSEALFEFAFAIKHAGATQVEMGARLSERCVSDLEPRDWHMQQIREAAAATQRAINAYDLALAERKAFQPVVVAADEDDAE